MSNSRMAGLRSYSGLHDMKLLYVQRSQCIHRQEQTRFLLAEYSEGAVEP